MKKNAEAPNHGLKKSKLRRQVLIMILAVSLTALLATCGIGMKFMLEIRDESEDTIFQDLTEDLYNILNEKTMLANTELERYAGFVRASAGMAEEIYERPEKYMPKEVLPPDPAQGGVYTLQRYLLNEKVSYADVREELELLANLEPYWKNIMEMEEGGITDIYLATVTGGQLSYNKNSDIGAAEDGGESYFDYTNSEWYTRAKNTDDVYFTGVYEDSYNRGMTISCSAPVRKNGEIVCVVSMDILVDDIQNLILTKDDIKRGDSFLVDRTGALIATTSADPVFSGGVNIYNVDHDIRTVAGQIVSATEDVVLSDTYTVYAHAKIPLTNWYYCICIPDDVAFASLDTIDYTIHQAIFGFLAAFVLVIAGVFVLSGYFSSSLTRPIDRLKKDVEIISAGNLEWQARTESKNEIGELAEAFNNMAVSLRQYIADLTRVTAEKERIGAELSIATRIQADMLPSTFPPFPDRDDIDLFATMDPAKEVGGDFYDFFFVDKTHLALVMADVSGKGVPAALFMVIAKTLIMMRAPMGGPPSAILSSVNEQLCVQNEESLFVTVWLGIFDVTTGELVSANAGHEYPAFRTEEGGFALLKERHSPPLATMEGLKFRDSTTVLRPGERIFLYTDGVTEATSEKQELFGEERLVEALNQHAEASPEELLGEVRREIDRFVGSAPQFDDITMLCLDYHPAE